MNYQNLIDTNQNTLTAHSENAISGTLNFNAGDNIVILDGQGKNYRGLSGMTLILFRN